MSTTAPVHCLFSEMRPTTALTPHPRNPNRHPESQITLLAEIIKARGWRNSIVVSGRSGFIVKGHGRHAAAIKAGLVECPVEVQAYESEADELADMLADNRLAELAEIDTHALRSLLEKMEPGAAGRMMAGFTEDEFAAMVAAAPAVTPSETPATPARNVGRMLRFGTKGFHLSDAEYEALLKRGEAYRARTGTSYGFARELLQMP